jgi:hypothetical protein
MWRHRVVSVVVSVGLVLPQVLAPEVWLLRLLFASLELGPVARCLLFSSLSCLPRRLPQAGSLSWWLDLQPFLSMALLLFLQAPRELQKVQLLHIEVWARAGSPLSTALRADSSLLELTPPSSPRQLLLAALPLPATRDQAAVSVCYWVYLP